MTLLLAVLDYVMYPLINRWVREGRGVDWQGLCTALVALLYAVDITLVSKHFSELRFMLEELMEKLKELGMRVDLAGHKSVWWTTEEKHFRRYESKTK